MTHSFAIGFIGDARTAEAIGDAIDFLPGLRLAAWSVADGDDTSDFQPAVRGGGNADWQSVASSPSLDALVIAVRGERRQQAVALALAHGKTVLCRSPLAEDLEPLHIIRESATRGKARLLAPGLLAQTAAGALAVEAARKQSLGRLHSLYAAARLPQGRSADVVRDLGPQMFEFVLSCAAAPLERVHASGGALFDAHAGCDTLVTLLRFADGSVATVELSCCLPATVACPPQGLVEFELIGAREVLRGEPYKAAVGVFTEGRAAAIPWTEDEWAPMLRELSAVLAGHVLADRDLVAQRRLLTLMGAVSQSLSRGQPVSLRDSIK